MSMLLSIVIPTKNRYRSLSLCLENLVRNIDASNKYEIIVQDNSDYELTDSVKNLVEQHENLIYNHSKHYLSVSANVEQGICMARGEFIIVIGDDDLVSNRILEFIEYMKIKKIRVLSYQKGQYFWPDIRFSQPYLFNRPDTLRLPKVSLIEFQRMDSGKCLDEVLTGGGGFYEGFTFTLPRHSSSLGFEANPRESRKDSPGPFTRYVFSN